MPRANFLRSSDIVLREELPLGLHLVAPGGHVVLCSRRDGDYREAARLHVPPGKKLAELQPKTIVVLTAHFLDSGLRYRDTNLLPKQKWCVVQLTDKVVHSDQGGKRLQDVGTQMLLRSGGVLDVIGSAVEHLSLILFSGRPREEVRTVRLVFGDVFYALGALLGNAVRRDDPDVSREIYAAVQLYELLVS